MSLEDCVQSALEKNLDMRIARYNPPMALADLQLAYAGYNPTFTFDGSAQLQQIGRRFQPPIGLVPRPLTADQNNFNSSLSGLTPWGLNYSLKGNLQEAYGQGAQGTLSAPFDMHPARPPSPLASRC